MQPLPTEPAEPAEPTNILTDPAYRANNDPPGCSISLVINAALERELLATMADTAKVDAMRESEKVTFLGAVDFLTRTGAEILRRDSLPSPGPSAICYESGPDGESPVRLSFLIMCF